MRYSDDVCTLLNFGLELYFNIDEVKDVMHRAWLAGINLPHSCIGHAANQLLCSAKWHCRNSSLKERKIAAQLGISVQDLRNYKNYLSDLQIIDVCRAISSAMEDGRTVFSPHIENLKMAGKIKAIFELVGNNAKYKNYKWWSNAIALVKNVSNWHMLTEEMFDYAYARPEDYNLTGLCDMITIPNGIQAHKMGCRNASVFKLINRMKHNNVPIPTFVKEAAAYNNVSVPESIEIVSDNNWSGVSWADRYSTVIGSLTLAEVKLMFAIYGVTEGIRKMSGMSDIPKRVCAELYQNNCTTIRNIKIAIDNEHISIPNKWDTYMLVEWLQNKIKTSATALLKERIVYGPEGRTRTFRYIDIIDEITKDDLINGIKTKPDTAFENAARRKEAELQKEMGINICLPKSPWKDSNQVHQIKTSDKLKEEGHIMNNCVAGYFKACQAKRCYIYHVDGRNCSATMEISPAGEIFQLYEAGNKPARKELVEQVNLWANSNRLRITWSAKLA